MPNDHIVGDIEAPPIDEHMVVANAGRLRNID
jgi:hypothetical protein